MKRSALIIPILSLLFFSLAFTSLASSYTNVTVSEAKGMIGSYPYLVVLDVRTQSEYNSGHIRNAKLIPLSELEGRLDEFNQNDEILVYCHSGYRSAQASQILANNDFLYVYNMLGGITAWINAGYPVYAKLSSIQGAINNADEGDTIFVSSGTYYENVIVNKRVLLVGENRENTVIDGNGTGKVVFVMADNVTISDFTVRNSGYDVYDGGIWSTSDRNMISNNLISNSSWGISLDHAASNIVNGNIIEGLEEHSYGSWGGGVILWGNSSKNIMFDNIIACHEDNGIFLDENSSENYVIANTILNQLINGISCTGSNNTLYHNSLLNNTNQAYTSGTNNTWDNGWEGNYWSDYDGVDSDRDGVGDTPYVIGENNTDNYPLMMPFMIGDVNHDGKVDILDVVKVTAIYGSRVGDDNWNPHSDLTEPYGVIDILDVVKVTANYGKEWKNP